MSLFKNTWFSKLAGKKNNTLEKEAAELAAKESAEQEAAELAEKESAEQEVAELAAKESAEQEVAELAAKELAEKEIAEEEAKEDAEDYVFKSWFSRLGIGLSKTSSRISEGITKALKSGRLDDDALEQIEENLILADVGATAASELISVLKNEKFDKIDDVNIKE